MLILPIFLQLLESEGKRRLLCPGRVPHTSTKLLKQSDKPQSSRYSDAPQTLGSCVEGQEAGLGFCSSVSGLAPPCVGCFQESRGCRLVLGNPQGRHIALWLSGGTGDVLETNGVRIGVGEGCSHSQARAWHLALSWPIVAAVVWG